MKNDEQMYQSVLSRRNAHRERRSKRIRTLRRTVPVLACLCFAAAYGLGNWAHLEKLPDAPVSSGTAEEQTTDTSESTAPPERSAAAESSPTVHGNQTDAAATAFSSTQAETVGASASGTAQTVTTTVPEDTGERSSIPEQMENREAGTHAVLTPVSEAEPVTSPQTTESVILEQPDTEWLSTAPEQTTVVIPVSTATEAQPVSDDGRLLYPVGVQISIESYKSMAAASYLIYNDLEPSAATDVTATIQTTAAVHQETTTVTTAAPDDTQTALEKLTQKENRLFGEFQRERAVILGELSPDAPRLTLDEVTAVIESSGSFAEICRKLHESQPFVDFIGGSGVTKVEYWFDEKGSQKIYLMMEEESIFYFHFSGAGMIYS